MLTISDVARERGADTFTNEHLFEWLSRVLADESMAVRGEFHAFPNADGEYRVTVTAREI